MKFSYNWLQSYFPPEADKQKKFPKPDKLADLLTMHSFEVEGLEDIEGDVVLDLDILPNRVADCSAYLGIAREISAILGLKTINEVGPPKGGTTSDTRTSDLKTEDFVSVEVKDEKLCPRYMALLIKGVKIEESPQWIKDRLLAVGVNSINNVVDIANYVMLETGQPLHAFDLDKLDGGKIIVRNAKIGEEIETLDDKKVFLSEENLIIADGGPAPLGGGPLAIAGIKGGKKAEISESTTNIILEAANFDGVSIRKTSKDVGIRTDASYRFEHNLPLALPEKAILRTAQMIKEIAGGEIADTTIDTLKDEIKPKRIIFNKEDVSNLLGKEVSEKDIEKILKNLGFKLERDGENYFAIPPMERTDVNIKEDVIEEVIRLYGYQNIESVLPEKTSITSRPNEEYFFSNFIRGILVDMGFTEAYNYSFDKIGKVELANPIAKGKEFLRTNLFGGLKENALENFKNFDEVKFFEIGKVFDSLGEKTNLAIIVANKKNNEKENEQELRGIVEEFLNKMSVANIQEFDNNIYENTFEVELDKIIEIAKENIDLPALMSGRPEVVSFESKDIKYKPFSKYPAIVRDISLFVPIDVRIEEVAGVIAESGTELLVDTDLFDEYTPPDSENKSLAFHLIFQSFKKTLTDEEVNGIRDKIINALEENKLWQVRK